MCFFLFFSGWIGSILIFLIFALAPVVVYMYSRLGFFWCMLTSSVFYCLSLAITPFVPNMNFVFLTFSIPTGISISFFSTLSIITQREYFSKYFGFAVGVRYSANALGSVVMSFILPFAFNGMGIKHTLLSMLALLPFILCYGLVVRHQVIDIRSYKNEKSTKELYWELLQDRSFTLSLVGIALYLFCSTVPHIFMVSIRLYIFTICRAVAIGGVGCNTPLKTSFRQNNGFTGKSFP